MNFEDSEPQRHRYKFRGLTFHVTCSGCPEQYDVFEMVDGMNFTSGYIRLRHGVLSVEYPEVLGRQIFSRCYEGRDLMGQFDSEQERTTALAYIADRIREVKKNRSRFDNPTDHLPLLMNKFVKGVMSQFDR